uniref:Putative secreted protein n=1 Tax=Anopheles triannulatus TaxID=58253 RepID=A0A2M4B7E6_9DIPT
MMKRKRKRRRHSSGSDRSARCLLYLLPVVCVRSVKSATAGVRPLSAAISRWPTVDESRQSGPTVFVSGEKRRV